MNKDLAKRREENVKELESEYKELMHNDVPDLWDRIEAGFEADIKQAQNTITNGIEFESISNNVNNIETINSNNNAENNAQDKNVNNKKIVAFSKKGGAWKTIVAACICIVVAIPVGVSTLSTKQESENSANSIAVDDGIGMVKNNSAALDIAMAETDNTNSEESITDVKENMAISSASDEKATEMPDELRIIADVSEAEVIDDELGKICIYTVVVRDTESDTIAEGEELKVYERESQEILEIDEQYELAIEFDSSKNMYRIKK